MEIKSIKDLGLTPEEFYEGFEEFVKNQQEELPKEGVPSKKVSMLYGKSNIGTYYNEYIVHLLNKKRSRENT